MIKTTHIFGAIFLLSFTSCSATKQPEFSTPPGFEEQVQKDFERLRSEGKIDKFDFPRALPFGERINYKDDSIIYYTVIDSPHISIDGYITLTRFEYTKSDNSFIFIGASSYRRRNVTVLMPIQQEEQK